MTEIFGALRRAVAPGRRNGRTAVPPVAARRQHNLFEAAAVFVAASAEDDEERMDEASGWVSPEQLSFGVGELACRAVIALARERGESPQTVARELLGLSDG
ncbi:hypothetical protein ACIOEZ_08915 [Streptomyces sp. NPDC087866]|uniref:hypothetical protein n=1 Tax=unclassified Streptomyces TaxID=2593676 RepID=UPI002250F811|nr:hypothetical protein [Streptomyces sp. NBC_01789]MCX4445214.1 hypothetical protein [Streptomyces sp. NBC_01789]